MNSSFNGLNNSNNNYSSNIGVQNNNINNQNIQQASNYNNNINSNGVNYNNNIQQTSNYNSNVGIQNSNQNINLSQNSYTNNIKTNKVNGLKNKKIVFLIIVILIICIIGVLVFNSDKNKSRTIMVYMVGSNLESESGLGTVDLDGIDYEEMDNKNVNVVLIAGGTEEWKNDYIDEDETSIYELTDSGYKKVKTQSLKNMGDADVFGDFLNYVYDNYKTDEYDLVFWNHGGAIIGSEFDDLSNDNLALSEMKSGLSKSKFNKNNKIETIIFRTCLNGTIEIADTFKDYSDYLVASEEITLGAPIASVLEFVNDIETSDTGYDVGIKFIESYKNQISSLKNYYGSSEYIYSTYSVVDLSKVDNLVDSLNEFISDINVGKNYNQIAKVRSNLYQYAYSQAEEPSYDMVDLYNLVDGLKDLSPEKAEKVLNNFEDTVLYNWATNSNSRGMSIYFPYNGPNDIKQALLKLYSSFNSFDEYNDFISQFYLVQSGGKRSYSFNNNKTTVAQGKQDADFSLELTDEQLQGYAKAEYLVFMDKGNGYYWPVYKGTEVELNGKNLNANINGKNLKIENESGSFVVPLFETYVDDKYIKYNTSVILQNFSSEDISEWKTDSAQLSLILDKSTEKVKVGSVTLNEKDANKVNSVAIDLNDYEYITFGSMSHKLLDQNGNFNMEVYKNSNNGVYEGVEITIDELKDFKLSNFNDENDYYCVFRIYDVNNNVYYSKLVKMN